MRSRKRQFVRWVAVVAVVLSVLAGVLVAQIGATAGCPAGAAMWHEIDRGWHIPGGEMISGGDLYQVRVSLHRDQPDGGTYQRIDVVALDPAHPVYGLCFAHTAGIEQQSYAGEPYVRAYSPFGRVVSVTVW